MTQYTILLSKKGTMVSLKVVNADPDRVPVKSLKGKHFSRLVGQDCRKDIYDMIQQISTTHQSASFRTFFVPKGSSKGPVVEVEWTMQPKSGWLLAPTRYLLLGKEPG